MHEKLIAGYAAYTDADEYGATALGEAPTSIETVSVTATTTTIPSLVSSIAS